MRGSTSQHISPSMPKIHSIPLLFTGSFEVDNGHLRSGDHLLLGIICGTVQYSWSITIRTTKLTINIKIKILISRYLQRRRFQTKSSTDRRILPYSHNELSKTVTSFFHERYSKVKMIITRKIDRKLTRTWKEKSHLTFSNISNNPAFIVAVTYPSFSHPYIFELLALASSLFSHSCLLSTLILHASEMIRSLQKADKSDFVSFIYRTLQSEKLTYVNWG